jgi:hypothetical protein
MTFGTPTAWFPNLLRRFHRDRPQPQERLGLNPDQQEAVSDLSHLPAWRHFLRATETLHRGQVEKVLSGGLTPEQYNWTTGYIFACEQLAGLPDTLATAKAEEIAHGNRTRPDRTDQPTARLWVNTPEYRAVESAKRSS